MMHGGEGWSAHFHNGDHDFYGIVYMPLYISPSQIYPPILDLLTRLGARYPP